MSAFFNNSADVVPCLGNKATPMLARGLRIRPVVATVRELHDEARRILSREPAVIPALPPDAPVLPADVFVTLLASFVALEHFAKRNNLLPAET